MHKKYLSVFPIIFVLSIIQIIAVDAIAYETGTIVTKAGARYENVTYDILHSFKIISFKLGDEKINVSFDKIEAIFDQAGTDITTSILGGYHKPKKETWKSETDPIIKKARQAKWSIGWRLGANYSIPISDYYEGIEPGIGFEGDLLIGLTHNIGMRLMVSKSGMKIEDDFSMFYSTPEATVLNEDYKISTMRYMICFQYFQVTGGIDKGKTMFYSYTGLGLITQKLTPDVTIRDNIDDVVYHWGESTSETNFAINLGIGTTTFFSKTTGLDFTVHFDEVFVDSNSYGQGGLAFVIDFKAALVILLH